MRSANVRSNEPAILDPSIATNFAIGLRDRIRVPYFDASLLRTPEATMDVFPSFKTASGRCGIFTSGQFYGSGEFNATTTGNQFFRAIGLR